MTSGMAVGRGGGGGGGGGGGARSTRVTVVNTTVRPLPQLRGNVKRWLLKGMRKLTYLRWRRRRLVLILKMIKVKSERSSSEMWKVAGLAIVCVVCCTSNAFVALATNIPLLYHWHGKQMDGLFTALLLVLYYFIGSSVPSALVLFEMRELPPPLTSKEQEESRTLAFISDGSVTSHPQRWITSTIVQNHQALASASQRRNLLQELFADVALEVDDRAKDDFTSFFLDVFTFLLLHAKKVARLLHFLGVFWLCVQLRGITTFLLFLGAERSEVDVQLQHLWSFTFLLGIFLAP